MGDDPTRTLHNPGPTGPTDGLAVLSIVSGASARQVPIPSGGLVIGRAEGVDLHLDADGVSRRHSRVIGISDGLFNVLDLGSTNGTFLNGRRIDVAVLREGDELQVGQVVMRFGYARERPTAGEQREVPPLAAQLTARELEIARLVAQGLTNAEIGKRLFISPRTVSTHLVNIYERLGIHTRAALASYFVQYDLGEGG